MKKRKRSFFAGLLLLLLLSGCGREEPRLILEDSAGEDSPKEQGETPESEASENLPEGNPDESAGTEDQPPQADGEGQGKKSLLVYVCGAVASPGVYQLEPGARVYQAIEAAGGLTPEADPTGINQARELTDGEQITVYRLGETVPPAREGQSMEQQDTRVNLNTAGKEELMTLTGIGETRAQAIIDYRQEHGPFASTEDLMQVDGIKEKTWEKIKEEITV